MASGTCRLCHQIKKLAKAHIVPRSFCLRAKGDSKQLLETRQHDVKLVKDWQNGVWDDQILCESCDGGVSQWDGYGFAVLGNPPGVDGFPQNQSEADSFVMKGVDYHRLKLFALSFLWRASISSQPFFARIQLGKHEARIAEMIRAQDPGSHDDFPVVLYRLIGQRVPNATYAPYRQRSPEGVNFCVLFLPSIKILVKVDQRPLPKILEPFVLKQSAENLVVPMPLHRNEVFTLGRAAEAFRRWASEGSRTKR